jgi:putative peptide zinc metalloprotease protein
MAEPFLSSSWYRVRELVPQLRIQDGVSRHRYRGRSWYVFADPASGRAYRFTPAAYMFMRSMNGKATIDEIWRRMAIELDDNAPTQDEIIRLLFQLYEADMLRMDRLPDAEQLDRLVGRQRHMELKNSLKNPLSITIPLWDPDSFLTRTAKLVRPLFNWGGLAAWFTLIGAAALMAALYAGPLTRNMDDRVLSADNLLLMALIYPVVKLIHELGHAYAVKVFGGEVHRLGVMFIAFYPVPYVDASASAVLPSKYQRAMVGAAGMMVELCLAAGALFLWLNVEPGLVHAAAFNVMVIAGISTVVVNGNPLLRFDAYYILSDLLEMPNLTARSTGYWRYFWDRYVFGMSSSSPQYASQGERLWLLLFAPLSLCYRMAMLAALSLFIASEYLFAGVMIALVSLYGTILYPLGRALHRIISSARLQPARRRVALVLGGGGLAFAMSIAVIPLPLHTSTEGIIWLPEKAYVRARADGFVEHVLTATGRRVVAGEPLVTSTDPFLDLEISLRRLRIRELEARLQAEQFVDRVQADITREELVEARSRLDSDLDRASRLKALSEAEGVFVAPAVENLPGRFFKRGDVIGYVLPDTVNIIRVVVSQDDIDLVRHHVRDIIVRPSNNSRLTLRATSLREVPAAADELPSKALAVEGGGAIAVDPREPSGLKALRRVFQIDLVLDHDLVKPAFGARTYVRFEHHWEPVAAQAYRKIRQLFLSHFQT